MILKQFNQKTVTVAPVLKKQTFSDMVETNDKLASIGDKKVDEQFLEPILNTGFYCQFLTQTPPL
jgi:hypothetical protein